jgi:hypothetical protein
VLEDQSKSEKVLRIARLYDRALEVFEDQQAAEKWLIEPARGLGEAIPFDLPDDWDILPPPDSTQTIGTEWAMICGLLLTPRRHPLFS